ncbi:hypothetical protein DPX16_21219 [Anabarilius grahami]|uniref:Uncharacterized protein n=1 Tax=Anabarilius grahami TaxID=495550 RepID=A0A3N0XIV0_ANAGA|nr:hypothetical protein DPX16_21219 [Anabarilius grahami]
MSSHSLPSLSPHERPCRQAQLPARYDDFILQYHPQSLSTTETPEQQPPYPAYMSGTDPHYQPRREGESEEELEEPELPTEGDTQEDIPHPHSTIPSERVPTSEAEHPSDPPIAPTTDTQSVLLQKLIQEIRNKKSSLNLQPVVSSQARQTTDDHRLPTFPPQQQLPSPPPVSRALLTQPVPQSMQLMHPSGCGQFPATSQAPALYNSMYPAYTLPSQPLPGVMSYPAQPAYNVQPHHLISAAPLSQLVPPGPQQSNYRRIEGPSFPDLTWEDESQYLMLKMALSNLLDPRESEQYKYHILLDHLKVDQARRLALAYVYTPDPYTQAIQALDEHYGQPRQLALKELQAIMEILLFEQVMGEA